MRVLKRWIALLLVLLLAAAPLSVAEAKTGTLVKNTGTRHAVCTALSDQARAYYTGNNTFADLVLAEDRREQRLIESDPVLFR